MINLRNQGRKRTAHWCVAKKRGFDIIMFRSLPAGVAHARCQLLAERVPGAKNLGSGVLA
jgi:hypothetical protein